MANEEIKFITSMEFSNIQKEADYWGTYHVNREDILFYNPEADISTVNKFFVEALDYIDNNTNFVSTDEAKISVFYTA